MELPIELRENDETATFGVHGQTGWSGSNGNASALGMFRIRRSRVVLDDRIEAHARDEQAPGSSIDSGSTRQQTRRPWLTRARHRADIVLDGQGLGDRFSRVFIDDGDSSNFRRRRTHVAISFASFIGSSGINEHLRSKNAPREFGRFGQGVSLTSPALDDAAPSEDFAAPAKLSFFRSANVHRDGRAFVQVDDAHARAHDVRHEGAFAVIGNHDSSRFALHGNFVLSRQTLRIVCTKRRAPTARDEQCVVIGRRCESDGFGSCGNDTT